MSAPDIPPTGAIRALVRTLLEQSDVADRSELLAQAEGIEYVDGPVTMMRLRVSRTYAPAKGVPTRALLKLRLAKLVESCLPEWVDGCPVC